MMSDESENDGVYNENNYESDVYYKKYKLLLERCTAIQRHNEQLVYNIQVTKRIINRRYHAVKLLKDKLLNKHNEDWTVIPEEELEEDAPEDVKPPKLNNVKIKEEKVDDYPEEKPKLLKKPTKRKAGRSEKDPRAPKRPSNPFFQFCQEQRQILMEQLNADLKPGEAELSKQELTRQLAIKWKSLSGPDKKVYVDRYERSKEKYAAEMSEYNMKK